MSKKQIRWRNRIIIALVLFVLIYALELAGFLDSWFGHPGALYAEFVLFLIPFLIAGYDVLIKAARNIAHGHGLDENFLMSVATIGAFALVFFPDSEPHMAEGAAVMLFYQVGELFQSYAVGKSRKSIADMMDIAPEYANVVVDGELAQVDPYEVSIDDIIIVKPGERVPLDGIIIEGSSQVDTSALTGESVPRKANPNDEVISGCLNLTSTLTIKVSKLYENSTVSRILELVENAAEKKAKTENFITRFARYYTPIVVALAVAIAIIPPLLFMVTSGANVWADWVLRGLTFLVVSCPCALVISIPLSFFGGIGGASKAGILIKGSNYLEMLSKVDTVVFDKTGTLTSGTFEVTELLPANDITPEILLEYAAHAEAYSDHPIARSILSAYKQMNDASPDLTRIGTNSEKGGHGAITEVDGKVVLAGNKKLMYLHDINYEVAEFVGTQVHIAVDGQYIGTLVIGDTLKADSQEAITGLHKADIKQAIMLTGDTEPVAQAVAHQLGLDKVYAELLPQDKVHMLESIMDKNASKGSGKHHVAFVGDGINDAPVLMRADVGIAMGAMGSDAAIEAADVVLMDDKPTRIEQAINIARKTMRIVWQNIVFALGVKFAVLILAAFGLANMWMAVFADVGVCVIAILNAMRAMRSKP